MSEKKKKALHESLRSGEQVDQILAKAIAKKRTRTQKALPWRKVLANYLLLLGFVTICGLILMLNLDNVFFLHGNGIATALLKIILILLCLVGYVKGRSALMDFLFPKASKEIIKTVYRMEPEMHDPKVEDEDLMIHWSQKNVGNYIIIAGFCVFVIMFILTQPSFLNATFGVLEGDTISSSVIKVVMASLAVGIYLTLRNLMMIHREYDNLLNFIWKIRKIGNDFSIDKNRHSLMSSLPEDPQSMVSRKVKSIANILKIKSDLSPDDLHDNSFYRYSILDAIPRYITSALPITGLIGTIIGLTMSIGGLEGVIDNALEDRSAFSSSLGSSLEGIGTAFYTTLSGMIGMLIMKFFNMLAQNTWTNFFIDMDEIMTTEVAPRIHKALTHKK